MSNKKAQHTRGPFFVHGGSVYAGTTEVRTKSSMRGDFVAICDEIDTDVGEFKARRNIHRIARCLNACDEIDNEDLKAGVVPASVKTQRDQLLEAAEAAWNCISELPTTQARAEVALMLHFAICNVKGGGA